MVSRQHRARTPAAAASNGATARPATTTPATLTNMMTTTVTSVTAAAAENKSQDLQHAVDLYQKGTEIAHSAATVDDYCRAIEHYSLAIAVCASQPRFFFARGNAFRAISEFEHAAKDYSAAIALDDRSPLYFANRGACYRKLNAPAAALEDLTLAIEMDAKKAQHYFSRALVLYDAGYWREAIVDLTRALEDSSSGGGSGVGLRIEYRALQTRGVCYRKLGLLAKCIDDLERAIRLDARNAAGFSALGQALYEQGDLDAAIAQYSRALELSKTSAAFFSHRGLCYYRKGEQFARECLADFNASVQLDGKDPQAYFYRGSMRLWLALELLGVNKQVAEVAAAPTAGNCPLPSTPAYGGLGTIDTSGPASMMSLPAVSAIRTAATPTEPLLLDVNGAQSTGALGFLTANEQLEAAFADIEMAHTLCPSNTQYQIGMAMVTQLQDAYGEARERFDAVHVLDRTNVVVQYHAALVAHQLGDRERALTLLSDAIDALPTEALLFETRGLVLQELQLDILAIHDLTRAIELAPVRAIVWYLRCESRLRLEQFTDAIADATQALALGYTTDVSVWNARGMAHRGLGDFDAALQDLSVCIATAPSNDIFRFHRGLCYMESSQYADAIRDLLEAANLNPRDTKMLYCIGLCYFHERETTESRTFLALALRYDPPPDILPDVYYRMGLTCALEGSNMDAIGHFTAALECSMPPRSDDDDDDTASSVATPLLTAQQQVVVHERAKALQLERYLDEAVEDFSTVIAHNPHNAHAYFRRGFAYKALGRLEDAASDLETAKQLDPTNLDLVVNYKEIKDTECIELCRPGDEKVY